jgi:D-alanyl-D-alanine carboxypeptidase/D-alanyl-D-alanine-endopeptidase (penicillin-binding protein 4)
MKSRSAASSFVLACVLALLSGPLSGAGEARVPNQTPRRRLETEVSRSLTSPAARGAVAGVLVERGGSPVIGVNVDRPLTPASLTKLATTTAALLKFGPTHRFETKVVSSAKPAGGTVAGDLVLVGGGDPAFVTEAYGRKRFLPSPGDPAPVSVFRTGFATVEDLARRVRAAGVERVTGDLVVDESLFDSVRTQRGWLPTYQKKGSVDVGNLSAMTVNEGFADVDQTLPSADPAGNAARLLRSALASRGVSVTGDVRHGRAPSKPQLIARVVSPTVADIVFYTNRWSVNYPPEMLVKGLGAKFGGAGTTEAGVRVMRDALAKIQIPLDGFSLSDASGLSVYNRLTPKTIAALIRHALDDQGPTGTAMRDSMPVAGGPGTLLKRLRGTPAAGNLRGKTALIRGVRGMAGWVTGTDGSTIVYVTLFNDAASAGSLTAALDYIGVALVRFPYF